MLEAFFIHITYTLDCRYDAAQPHAVSFDGNRAYTYDQNGNMTEYVSSDGKQWRKLFWDDENRLIRTQDNAGTVEYAYDEGGLRSRKKSALGETLYVSANYSVRNGEVYSKHVFAGNTRLATTMVKRKGTAATELGVYYYHGDHLGSSNVITDRSGQFHEHLEYFPYGETWVHEKAAGSAEYMAHLFTGKEFDPETGLYYHGHRYRDPRLGGWQSADPALLEYLPTGNKNKDSNLPGMGGVFNPVNLNLYHYAGNNPVKFIDPDGKKTVWLEGAGPEVNSASYSRPIIQKMAQQGIKNPVWLNFKHPSGAYHQAGRALNAANNRITRAEIDAIKETYDRSDGQYNLSGYSLGGVRAGQAALEMADEGKVIDNLVLIGTPIDKSSDLYKSLTSNKNIKNVISIDVEGDFLSNEQGKTNVIEIFSGAFKHALSGGNYENAPHFYYTTNDKGQQDQLVKTMKDKGVK